MAREVIPNVDMKTSLQYDKISIRVAMGAGLFAALSVVLYRTELVDFRFAVSGLAIAALSGTLAALLGVIALFRAMLQRKSALLALIGSLLAFIVVMPVLFSVLGSYSLPHIHDITTDLDNPPVFLVIANLRTETDNPLDRQFPDLAQLQREGYPDLKPLQLDRSPESVFEQVLQLVESRGWEIVAAAASAEKSIIEATATTPIMGFKDDVIIRIEKTGEKVQVDMRSVSRVGLSDLGANAKRIRQFLNDLENNQSNP